MSEPFLYFHNIADEAKAPDEGILSRTIVSNDNLRVVMFAFSAGQELTEHTSTMEAVMHFLSGEADVTLGTVEQKAGPGTWVRMEPKLKHSIRAKTPVQMMLILVKKSAE
jgi:quercetin dioxygenase-like cupin family protein